MDESFALTRKVAPTSVVAVEAGHTVVVAPAPVFVGVLSSERRQRYTTVSADGLLPADRFEDGFSNCYGHHMLARTGLVLPRGTRTVRWDFALDVDGVRVVVGVLVGVVDYLYVAATEDGELEGFPLRSFLNLFVALKYL
jgi:hypothetical protein